MGRVLNRVMALILAAAALPGCGKSLDSSAAADFEKAQRAFEAAQSPTEYLIAADLFQKVVERGIESGAVYYNQGNAFLRGGKKGHAIACYRQAERYLPRDPQLAANLQAARAEVRVQKSRSLVDDLFVWQSWISYPAKVQLSLATGFITLVLGMVSLRRPMSFGKSLAWSGLVLTALFSGSAFYDWYRFDYQLHGVVVAEEAVARKGNADGYEPALSAPLTEGTEFLVLEQRGNWYLVQLPAGQVGWLPRSAVVVY